MTTPEKSDVDGPPGKSSFMLNRIDSAAMFSKQETNNPQSDDLKTSNANSVRFDTSQDLGGQEYSVFTAALNETYSTDRPAQLQTQERQGVFTLIVKHYRISFACALGLELLACLLSLIYLLDPDYKLFPIDFTGVPLDIRDDKSYLRYLAYDDLWKQDDLLPAEADKVHFVWRSKVMSYLEVVYQGSNVLSKRSLQTIQEIEKELTSSEAWQNWSLTDSDSNIKRPKSILRYFDGSVDPNLNDTEFTDISNSLYSAYSKPWYTDSIKMLIAKDAVISPLVAKSTLTRSVFFVGVRFTTKAEVTDFWRTYFGNRLKELHKQGRDGLKIFYYTDALFEDDTIKQVWKDLLLAIGSGLFILTFVFVQTGSAFITFFGLFSIFASFLWTNLVYRVLLDFRYFGIFHAMAIFIILGIGSDDLFVFYDMWRLTALMDLDTSEQRFSFCYRHATLSMLITSVTTSAAFVSNIFTPLYGVSSFALFSAMLVMINYLSAIVFFPLTVLLYHKDIEPCRLSWRMCVKREPRQRKKTPKIIIRFFKNVVHKVLTHKILRWVLVGLSTVNAVVLACVASRLDISDKDVQYYRSGLNYQDVTELRRTGFKKTLVDTRIKVYLVFGAKEQDLSTCPDYDYKCKGTFHYDDSLDLNSIPAQTALMDACKRLMTLEDADGNLHVARDETTGKTDMTCFLEKMDDYFVQHAQMLSAWKVSMNLELPVSGIKYAKLASFRQDLYNSTILDGNFYRFFETAVSYWLTNGYSGNFKTGQNYNQDLWLSRTIGLSFYSDDMNYVLSVPGSFYGARLRFITIELKTNLFIGATDYRVGLAAYAAWQNLTQEIMSNLPPTVQGFQVSGKNEWHTFKVSRSLQRSAVRGIVLGAILAFLVLTIATSNIILSFIATVNILLVVASFAGCIYLLGWQISIIESMNLSLVTGLSVDYVVHFSESYHHAPHGHRVRKVRDMLEHMGVSVLSGAFTTSGAAVFMLFAEIYFFYQFGMFIIITILFSIFYCLFWFTPLLSIIGPVDETGSLVPIYRWMVRLMVSLMEAFDSSVQEQKKMSYSRSFSLRSPPHVLGESPSDTSSVLPPELQEYKNTLLLREST